MKRWLAVALCLAACSDKPLARTAMLALTEEVVIFEMPFAGGAATAKLEFAPLGDVYGGAIGAELAAAGLDFHAEAQVRYAAPILGGRADGDFVPYLDVTMVLENLETGVAWEAALVPGLGLGDGWHYMADVDLDGAIGLSEAAYEAELKIRGGAGVVIHSDLLGAKAGTFLSRDEEIEIEGFFTLEDLAAPPMDAEGAKEPAQKPKKPMGYMY